MSNGVIYSYIIVHHVCLFDAFRIFPRGRIVLTLYGEVSVTEIFQNIVKSCITVHKTREDIVPANASASCRSNCILNHARKPVRHLKLNVYLPKPNPTLFLMHACSETFTLGLLFGWSETLLALQWLYCLVLCYSACSNDSFRHWREIIWLALLLLYLISVFDCPRIMFFRAELFSYWVSSTELTPSQTLIYDLEEAVLCSSVPQMIISLITH